MARTDNASDGLIGDNPFRTAKKWPRLPPTRLLGALSVVTDLQSDMTPLQVLQIRRLLEPAATAIAAVRFQEIPCSTLIGAVIERLGMAFAQRAWPKGRQSFDTETWDVSSFHRP